MVGRREKEQGQSGGLGSEKEQGQSGGEKEQGQNGRQE